MLHGGGDGGGCMCPGAAELTMMTVMAGGVVWWVS